MVCKDDYLSVWYMAEPFQFGPYAGHRSDKEKWDMMLDRLYELHGWDKATGLPILQALMELGLEDIGERQAAAGKSTQARFHPETALFLRTPQVTTAHLCGAGSRFGNLSVRMI